MHQTVWRQPSNQERRVTRKNFAYPVKMAKYLIILALIVGAVYVCEAAPTESKEKGPLPFPGRNWCGEGVDNRTKACCLEHGKCPYTIPPFQKRYDLFNALPVSIYECKCETQFYFCLLKAKSPVAATVGRMHFNAMRSPCFNLVKRNVCLATSWLDWFGFGCEKYGEKLFAQMSWLTGLVKQFLPAP